ncbi:MAG: GtrA family protein [Haliea sp.]|jgi:putative flippase GtrA|nr:GtrA family protein [Haliea sp.]
MSLTGIVAHSAKTLARFGIVGIAATTTHIVTVSILLHNTQLAPIASNTLAFLAAMGISFLGNLTWTFHLTGQTRQALRRFLVVSITAYAANTFLLSRILINEWFTAQWAAIFAAMVIPIITYLASRFWIFRDHSSR